MGKRFIKVDKPMVPRVIQTIEKTAELRQSIKAPPGCKRIFVKNLPYDCTEEDVRTGLQECGKISNIRLAVWGHTNQLKGFGYVDFVRDDSAEIAVKKSGKLAVKGRAIICDFETGEPKGSFRDTSGQLWNKSTVAKKISK